MKKTFIAMGLVLGLLGATLSRGWSQGLLPWHIDTYGVTSTTGSFIDISTNPNAVALGAEMDPGTDLKNKTFGRAYNATDKTIYDSVTVNVPKNAFAIDENNITVPGFPLGFNFRLGGLDMKYFTVSGFGGVFFRDSSMQPPYMTSLGTMGRWGVYAHPYISTSATGAPTMAGNNLVVTPASGAPAYYLIEGEEGQHVLTVQHHYQVRGKATEQADEWTFQFKFYEATGKIEFIVKELEYANALSGRHRIAITVTDFANYPTLDANGNDFEPVDPYKATGMNLISQNNHRVFVAQTDDMSAAKGWDTIALAYAVDNNATMRIDADHHPEPGHTITFTPKEAPATADITPLDPDCYAVTDQTATATTFSAKIYYKADMFTAQSLHEAGPIVAVLSESETPDYTLQNGVLYAKGDKLTLNGEGNGFQPQVLAVQSSKATANWAKNTVSLPSSNYQVVLTANGLEKAHIYYIHLYRMAYAGTNAPAYSTVCHTITFTTDFAEPKQFTQVGLSDINKVTLKVEPADGLSVLVVKSKDLNVKPSGQLKKGDKIGDAEVLELLDAEKEWDLPLAYGEGCFIVAFSVNTDDPNHYIYAPTKKYFSVGTAYKELPGLVDFSGCAFGVPNFEYNGINMKTQDYGTRLAPTIARDLPFGYTRTPYTAGTQQRVFGLGKPGSRTPVTVYAYVVPDVDFITPPIVANKNRILATFNADWVDFDDYGGSYDHYSFASSANGNDICSIEYSIDGGEWQAGVTYKGYDEIFTSRDDNGYFPISYALIADADDSFIGKKIRFRFISKTTMQGTQGAAQYLIIPSIDIKEDKLCTTPKDIKVVDAQTTTNQITIEWDDENRKVQQETVTYHIDYKVADDTTDNWLPKNATDTVCVINNLSPFTQYAFRVSANCGSAGTSYNSKTAKFSTIHTFPYAETMAEDSGHFEFIGGSNAYIRGEDPFARGVVAATGTLPETGNANLTPATVTNSFRLANGWDKRVENKRIPQSLAVKEFDATAWLLPAPVFIKEYSLEYGDTYAQVIRFKANNAYSIYQSEPWQKGSLSPKFADAKLYILLSHNGTFSMADTIATIAVGARNIVDETFEFEVPESMTQEGRAQVAFYYTNPDAPTTESAQEANNNFMLFEIYDFEFTYSSKVCIPLGELTRTNTTTDGATFEWEGYSDHYRFFWGQDPDNYTNSAVTAATTFTLTGLKDYTRYYVKVEGYCDAEETQTTPNHPESWFMTFEACHVPTDFAVSDITINGATFSSTDDQNIMTKRLVYLTPTEGETRIIAHEAIAKDTLTVTNLLYNMSYVAKTRAVCDNDSSDLSEPITFKTLTSVKVEVQILPDTNAGKVDGTGHYLKGSKVTISATPAEGYDFIVWEAANGEPLGEEATYTFEATDDVTYTALFETIDPNAITYTIALNVLPNENAGRVTGAGKYREGRNVAIKATPNEGYMFVAWLDGSDTLSKNTTHIFKAKADATYTALFESDGTANEAAVKAAFNVSANNGQLIIRNLKGLTIEEVTVYGLTGRKLGHFTPNSRENLTLPINAERALLLVRVASEQGVAIYKVYLH